MSISKKKVATSATAVGLAAMLLLGGTFAWQSISQTALNEASDVINPGGRLHDDFNGENKDVYVENFAEDDIFARIRLDEYFEIVQKTGTTTKVHTIAGTKDDEGNIDTWSTHYFDSDNATDEYWNWSTGGQKVFMPTFNKNKDSLEADINGTYYGPDNTITDLETDDRYTDYQSWELGDVEDGSEIYDADTNGDDEVGNDFENLTDYVDAEYIVTEDATHEAQETLNATLMSMQTWMDEYNSEPGEYWVYDTDGWVYWAQPIQKGEATGLLLDGISLDNVMDDSWYYAINVVAQFITADDLGKSDGTGFYADGESVTDEALALLEKIGVDISGESSGDDDYDDDYISTIDLYHDGEDTISGGEWLVFTANVYDENGDYIAGTDEVTFSLADQNGNPVGQSGISTLSNGIITTTYMEDNNLFVADDIMNSGISALVVTAEYTDESNGSYYSNEYTLNVEGKDSPLQFSMMRNGVQFPHLNDNVYQVFTYTPLEEVFDFDATLNEGVANVNWTFGVEEGYKYTVSEEIDGYVYAIADDNWKYVVQGTKIAKINTTTGVLTLLIDEEIDRSMYLLIKATTTDGTDITRLEDLFIRRLYVNGTLYDTTYSDATLKPTESVYTKGIENTFTLSADLIVDGEKIQQADLSSKLTNWKLYAAQYMFDSESYEIDSSNYSIANNNDGTWTLTINKNVTEDYLLVVAEYDYEKSIVDAEDGIFELTYNIVESEMVEDEETVDNVVIENEYLDEYEVYTSGEKKKIKLYATAYSGENPVYSGKLYWDITDADGNSVENAYLVYDEYNTFEAEVWILGETADVIKVYASYAAEEGGITYIDEYCIYETNSVPTE